MTKTAKIKSDLDDVSQLVDIIQILKDVASNHFYNTAKRKERFEEFAISFTDFFRMVSLAEAKSPLVTPKNDKVAIVPVTSEGGFMADMTARVCKLALQEAEKHNTIEFVIVGHKGKEKLSTITDIPMSVHPGADTVDRIGLFKVSYRVKKYLIDSVTAGKFSRVFAVYPRARTISLIKPVVIKLLPSEELLFKQKELKDVLEKVIVESDLDDVIHELADIWLTCRLFEMLEDCVVAGFAAQAQQLEASLERLKKDKKGLIMSFRKSKKSDIDKSLREVFSARLITG